MFPDVDIYASAFAFFINEKDSMSFHRTLTHSVVTSTIIFFFFLLVEALVNMRNNKREKFIYEVEAGLDKESLLALSGTLSTQEKSIGLNFRGTIFFISLFYLFFKIIFKIN